MSNKELYRLADSTAVEPLINKYPVWSDVISPAPYSLHLQNYQLKSLASYLENPGIHVKACQNPKLIGGPFVDIAPDNADKVKAFFDKINTDQAHNIGFAKALTDFYNYISGEATGQSLESYYEKLPDALRGYVELVYDYYNHPIVRVVESLLYESPYYNKEIQSLKIFQQSSDDSRKPFVSTPRLLDDGQIDWAIPFENELIDELFKLESAPRSLSYVKEILNLGSDADERLLALLSQEPHRYSDRWTSRDVRIRYFGHASVLVEWNGVSVLTDPWIGVRPAAGGLNRLSYDDLPEKIDFVVITHGHHDHFVPESLLRLRHRIGCLVVPRTFGMFYTDPSLKLLAQKIGFKNILELDALESIKIPDGEIIAVPFLGEHADLAHGKAAYVVRAGKEQIMFAADSNCLDKRMYDHIRRILGPIKTVFLGMECVGAPLSWLYGALVPVKPQRQHDQSRRTQGCNSVTAMRLLEAVGSERVYVYAMGQEPWFKYSMGLALSEDAPQMKESSKLLFDAREKGFIDAQRPLGKFEMHLPLDSNPM